MVQLVTFIGIQAKQVCVCVWFKGISVELMKTISAWVNVKQFSDSLSLIIQTEAAIK